VGHHVALSVVGTERLQASGYFRGKMAQENMIKGGGIPYTIVRSTQFYEFMGAIAPSGAGGQTVRLSTAYMQPIAADDVADAMADVALGRAGERYDSSWRQRKREHDRTRAAARRVRGRYRRNNPDDALQEMKSEHYPASKLVSP
jgi:uncharacterized protein YbjT (DUF2867 family)